MNRRGFLLGMGGILASAAAPAIVRADSLMRVIPVATEVLTPCEQTIVIDQLRGDAFNALREAARLELSEWWGRTVDGVICRALVDRETRMVVHFEETPLEQMPFGLVPGYLPGDKEGDTIKVKLP